MTIQFDEKTRIHHATKAKAEKLSAMLAAEYPALTLDHETNEDKSQIRQWLIVHTSDGNATVIMESDKVPELAAILAVCEDEGIDPEEGFDDEPESSGSVVPIEYRQQYKEASSNGQTCGDWLAEWLTTECHGVDGFVVDEFRAIVEANGLSQTAAWAKLPESGQKGWVGRWRMNGRQSLEKQVALSAELRNGRGEIVEVPADEMTRLQSKHARFIAKATKAAKAAMGE